MKSRTLGCVAIAALLVSLAAAQGRTVGSFTVARNVTYSPSGSDSFLVANAHDGVRDGSLVRTGKRAFGEIVFNDSSVLRVNERTDLVVHDSPSLRKIALNSGAVWVKVKTGTHTSVQTPVGTATARGTAFLVGSSGYLHVFEGTVELADPQSKEILLVHAGETALIGATGLPQLTDPAAGSSNAEGSTDTMNGSIQEGFPQGWYMNEGQMYGTYSDSGGTSDQGILPVLLWHPWIGLLTAGTGFLFPVHGGTPRGNQPPPTPEPGTILIVATGIAAYAKAKAKKKRTQI